MVDRVEARKNLIVCEELEKVITGILCKTNDPIKVHALLKEKLQQTQQQISGIKEVLRQK